MAIEAAQAALQARSPAGKLLAVGAQLSTDRLGDPIPGILSVDLDGDADTTELTPLDLDGNPRFADVVASPDTGCGAVAIVDMGAYEFPGTALSCLRPGDVNGDGTVNVLDLIELLLAFGSSCDVVCCLADFDNDGSVNRSRDRRVRRALPSRTESSGLGESAYHSRSL